MDALTLSRAVRAVRSRVGASRASARERGAAGFVVPARSTRATRAREGRARAFDGDVVATARRWPDVGRDRVRTWATKKGLSLLLRAARGEALGSLVETPG